MPKLVIDCSGFQAADNEEESTTYFGGQIVVSGDFPEDFEPEEGLFKDDQWVLCCHGNDRGTIHHACFISECIDATFGISLDDELEDPDEWMDQNVNWDTHAIFTLQGPKGKVPTATSVAPEDGDEGLDELREYLKKKGLTFNQALQMLKKVKSK